METCVIFCAGGFDSLAEPMDKSDLIIAADGGLTHLEGLGVKPHVIIGDFDSLGRVPADATVFPVDKDDTDSMLAIRHGLWEGYRRFVIYGGLDGPRLDHTIANLQALQFLADRNAQGFLVGLSYIATIIRNGRLSFGPKAQGVVSVFCMGRDARGVTLRGLKYGMEDGTLSTGFPLGVSNHFVGEKSEIYVKDGSLLVIFDRENPLPEVVPC